MCTSRPRTKPSARSARRSPRPRVPTMPPSLLDAARGDLGAIAMEAYRSGGSFTSIEAILGADGFDDVIARSEDYGRAAAEVDSGCRGARHRGGRRHHERFRRRRRTRGRRCRRRRRRRAGQGAGRAARGRAGRRRRRADTRRRAGTPWRSFSAPRCNWSAAPGGPGRERARSANARPWPQAVAQRRAAVHPSGLYLGWYSSGSSGGSTSGGSTSGGSTSGGTSGGSTSGDTSGDTIRRHLRRFRAPGRGRRRPRRDKAPRTSL